MRRVRVLDESTAGNGTRALAANRDGGEIERLLAELKSKDAGERDLAARALSELGDTRAATSLAAALQDEVDDVRWSAAAALAKLGDARARDFYLAAIREGSQADRWTAVWALGHALQGGDRRVLGPLREALSDPSPEVSAAAQHLLGAEQF